MKTKKLLSTQIVYWGASAFIGHSYEMPFTMWKDRPFWPLAGWDRASQGHVLTIPCDFYVPQAFCIKMNHESSQNTCFTDKPINALIYPPKCEWIHLPLHRPWLGTQFIRCRRSFLSPRASAVRLYCLC